MSNQQETKTITFTPALRDALRESYDSAVENNLDEFIWHGNAYVTGYAKYVLEHLDNQFGGAG